MPGRFQRAFGRTIIGDADNTGDTDNTRRHKLVPSNRHH
jgi:hypothetical protein